MAKEKKLKSLEDLKKKFGRPETEYLDTGIPPINEIWSMNGEGMATGKIIEIHSESGLGKTTLICQICKYIIEKYGKKVGYQDIEHALDTPLKEGVGIAKYETEGDPAMFLHLSPAYFTEVEDTTDYMISEGYDIIILDSLTNVIPNKREEGSITDVLPGSKSALQAVFLEVYKPKIARSGTTLIIVNQMRTKISFIKTTVAPAGGYALQFDTDIRTALRRLKWITNREGDNIGIQLEAITIKNKMTFPFQAVKMNLMFGKGIDINATYANYLLERKLVVQKGAFFSIPAVGDVEGKNVQGTEAFENWVRDNLDFVMKLLGEVRQTVNEGIDPEHTEPANVKE